MRKSSVFLITFFTLSILFLVGCNKSRHNEVDKIVNNQSEVIQKNNISSQNTMDNSKQWDEPPVNILEEGKKYFATLKTDQGDIKIELFAEEMPITVNNFVFLADENYYNGVVFHRVIGGFMIQGGDPTGTGMGGPGYRFEDEFVEGLSNVKGTISMANAGPDTNGSQFFINLVDNTNLDFDKPPLTSGHAVFGKVIEGIDIVEKIGSTETGLRDRPVKDIVINEVVIEIV